MIPYFVINCFAEDARFSEPGLIKKLSELFRKPFD
jgi:hypothetical protein